MVKDTMKEEKPKIAVTVELIMKLLAPYAPGERKAILQGLLFLADIDFE